VTNEDTIEVYTARTYFHLIYDANGRLLSKSTYDYRIKPSPLNAPPEARRVFLPAPPYLWPLTNPFYAFLLMAAAMALSALSDRGLPRGR
jgi:hypothetical protein